MTMEMFAILMLHSLPYFAMGSSCVSGGDISFEKGHVGRLTCGTCNPGEIIPCGACSIEPDSGNPGADLKSLAMQGLTLSTPRSSLLQSASSVHSLNLSLDLMVKMVSFRGQPVNASLIVEFVDQDDTNVDQGYTSVFHDLGQIASGMAWRTVTAAIADIHSVDMPMGWQGSGAFHPALHTPMLPKNRTFASVIANADVIRFTTFVPGMMYSTDLSFDISPALRNLKVVGRSSDGALLLLKPLAKAAAEVPGRGYLLMPQLELDSGSAISVEDEIISFQGPLVLTIGSMVESQGQFASPESVQSDAELIASAWNLTNGQAASSKLSRSVLSSLCSSATDPAPPVLSGPGGSGLFESA